MNRFSEKNTNVSEYNLQQNQLGQASGSKPLFRDRYKILQVLGRGGFGITVLAEIAPLPGKPLCVIKKLSPKATSDQSRQNACRRFEKEAKILGQLGSHSQIPMLIDYFEVKGEFYLVQEYVPGYTLAQEVQRTGPKTEAAVKQFLQELLPVLQYIHQNGVIHRDIKPHNLLRCEDDRRLVLIDFGAVKEKLVDAGENSLSKTATTNFIGTMGFAPPEQFSLRPVYASDIYALGMTCIYLLSGKGPLEFEYNQQTGDICWRTEINVSNSFASILDKMLKFSLNERFKSIDDVIRAFDMQRYLPSLNNCLTNQPLSSKSQSKEELPQTYLPPAARTALNIREWKAKLQAKKSHHQLPESYSKFQIQTST